MSNEGQFIDHGFGPKPEPPKPVRFKRATAKAFWVNNILLKSGEPAFETDTYRFKIGDGKTLYNSLPYIGEGRDGKSAYKQWIDAGHSGTIDDFLDSLIGPAGKSAYEIWLSLGNEGTIVDFINSLHGEKGEDGKSAYELWLEEGHSGTVTDFLNSLVGKSAYQIWLDLGNQGTEQDFIDSLKGADGADAFEVWKREMGLPEATFEDYMDYLTTTTWAPFDEE